GDCGGGGSGARPSAENAADCRRADQDRLSWMRLAWARCCAAIWWRALISRARKPVRARTCCDSGFTGRGCARCCAIASTPLLDRQRGLELPQCSDIFGVKGLGFLRRLELPEPDGTLLREQLALHDLIATQMRGQEKRIAAEFRLEPMHARLLKSPGSRPNSGGS